MHGVESTEIHRCRVLLQLANGRPHGPVRHRQLWVCAMRRGEPISGRSLRKLSPRDDGGNESGSGASRDIATTPGPRKSDDKWNLG
eukprot:763042-Amphidinium_carterae.1